MRPILLACFLLLLATCIRGQKIDSSSTFVSRDSNTVPQPQEIVASNSPSDSSKYNRYGDLLADDPAYNPRYPLWIPAVRVFSADLFNWSVARFIYKYDWAKTGPKYWKINFQKGPEWDEDGFGISFIGHPHTGSFYYNVARSNGYSYWASLPFAIQGSVTWEYFGENTRPSYNDMINTPISGMFLGEVFYRLSSNILDDRTRGGERVFRELLAGIVNPTRALNRLTQGKMFRRTTSEVYQKEPLNITLSGGIHKVNNKIGKDNNFGSGATNGTLHLQLDYGDPFEIRHRKPFDLFRFRVELSYGDRKNLLNHIDGYGILAGTNTSEHKLLGLFQHYDYWHNDIFEVATLGFGGGLIADVPVAKHSHIYSNFQLAIVPLAGNNNQFGPIESEFRQYNFGGGAQAKLEERFNLHNWASIGFTGYYYWIHTYNGFPGNSLVAIFKPVVTARIFKNLSVGFEHHIYRNDRFLKGPGDLHVTRTEQKLFLQLFLEDGKRYGKYH